MTENQTTSVPGLNELLGLIGTNPLAGLGRTFDQLRRGVGDLVHTIENINATMTELNRIATRVNNLIDTVEEPIQRVAPGLASLADTLSSPALTKMPDELSRFIGVIGDVANKLQPLGQLAEAAGGMFGLRNLAGSFLGGATTPNPANVPPAPAKIQAAVTTTTADRPADRRPVAKQSPAKKSPTSKAPAKKSAARKPVAKKAPAKQR
jgi:ABC-type transporter Mla subunit MlaD